MFFENTFHATITFKLQLYTCLLTGSIKLTVSTLISAVSTIRAKQLQEKG